MRALKFSVSPLFILFALFMLLLFDAVLFIIYIASVLLHEYAHYLAALRCGLRMDEVKLHPFGAVLYGELTFLSRKQEIFVALAGPALNLALAVIFTALWWIFPALYMFTDHAVLANTSLALFNLLPVYPLDGGRVAYNLMLLKMPPKRAFAVLHTSSMVFCALLFCAYIVTCFFVPNYTAGIAALLILSGALELRSELAAKRTFSAHFSPRRLRAGLPVKALAVSCDITLFDLVCLLSSNCYYDITVVDGGGSKLAELDHAKLSALVLECDLHAQLKDVI